MGSIRFYEDQRREEIHCAILLDLVGHDVPVPGLEDLLFITGMESACWTPLPIMMTIIKWRYSHAKVAPKKGRAGAFGFDVMSSTWSGAGCNRPPAAELFR